MSGHQPPRRADPAAGPRPRPGQRLPDLAAGILGTGTDRHVQEAFIELTDTLVTDFDIIDYLERLAARSAGLLEVAACGVLLADHHGQLTLAAASSEPARLLELTQLQNDDGPCLHACRTGRPVQLADLAAAASRWPAFTAAARAAGYAAVQALPMRLRADRLGALNLFTTRAGPLDTGTIALGQALADAATIGIMHQRALARSQAVTEQLQTALTSRIIIEQAKGFLAERLGVTVDEAFAILRHHARSTNRKLTSLAADITVGRLTIPRPPGRGQEAGDGEQPQDS